MYLTAAYKPIEHPYTNKILSILLGEVQLFLLIFPFADFFVTFGKWINLTSLFNFLNTALAGCSLIYLFLRKRVNIDLRNSVLLFSLIGYMLISVYWVHPLMQADAKTAIVRTLLTIIQTIVIVQIFGERSEDELLDVLKRFAIIITILSFLSIVIFPSESSWTIDDTGRKQAFYSSPNNLGQFLAFAFLMINFHKTRELKVIWLIVLNLILFYEVFQCDSKTSMTGALICVACYWFRNLLKPLFFVAILIGVFLPIYTNVTQSSKNVQKIDFANRDLTFTGRSDVWDMLITDVQRTEREAWGFGFGGYWGEKTNHPKATIDQLDWEPHQSHNGYLDLRISLGLVGFFIFLIFLIHYIYVLFKRTSYANVVVIFITLVILINNMTESSLFRQKHFYFVLFMLLYWFVSYKPQKDFRKSIN